MTDGINTLITKPDVIDDRMACVLRDVRGLVEFGPVMVTVARHVPKRSLDQNALMWSICGDIAAHLNKVTKPEVPFDAQDLHDRLLVERYGHEKRLVGQIEVTRVPQTRRWDKARMGEFLTWIIAWALDRRIPIEIPASEDYAQFREANA